MENITDLKNKVRQELEYRASLSPSNAPDLKRHLIANQSQTDFVLLNIGWFNGNFKNSVLYHIQIKDGKIWILTDNTDVGIASKLAERGISKSDIVLGFLPKYAREMSEFSVA